MKSLLVLTTLVLAAAGAMAKNATTDTPRTPRETKPSVTGLLRVVKADGNTVVARAMVGAGLNGNGGVRLRGTDALTAANGVCTFGLRLDEVSSTALTGSVNRFYANDVLLAQTAAADLQAKVMATSSLQLGLPAGTTMLKVVLDADGAQPTTGWARITVDGTCIADPGITPSSPAWRTLFNAWGYSNYAVKQLQDKGYAGYDTLVAVNADLAKVVAAKAVSQADYDALMARWNAIAADDAFKALMATVKPGKPGQR